MEHTYNIHGMTCSSCTSKVRDLLLNVKGVTDAVVTLNPPTAKVNMSEHVAVDVLNKALSNSGKYSLSESTVPHSEKVQENPGIIKLYYPLILIASFLIGGVVLRELQLMRFSPDFMMINFMGGFFVIFSFFKLLDVSGFAEGYGTYDIIAKKFPVYGKIYPFLELSLGISYLISENLFLTNIFTLILMLVSSTGVIKSILEKRQFQCACLGTIFKLPLTKVTLVEDLLMAAMAALMLTI